MKAQILSGLDLLRLPVQGIVGHSRSADQSMAALLHFSHHRIQHLGSAPGIDLAHGQLQKEAMHKGHLRSPAPCFQGQSQACFS